MFSRTLKLTLDVHFRFTNRFNDANDSRVAGVAAAAVQSTTLRLMVSKSQDLAATAHH